MGLPSIECMDHIIMSSAVEQQRQPQQPQPLSTIVKAAWAHQALVVVVI
jgi:hypothetical protein